MTSIPFHLSASQTQQFAYCSPPRRHKRIHPSLPYMSTAADRFCRLITVKLLTLNGRIEYTLINRSRRRTVDADSRPSTTSCIFCAVCAAVKLVIVEREQLICLAICCANRFTANMSLCFTLLVVS